MKAIKLSIDKDSIDKFILQSTNGPGSRPSPEFNRFSLMGATIARKAQQISNIQIGDESVADLNTIRINKPSGYLAYQLYHAHREIAETRNHIGLMNFGSGGAQQKDIESHYRALKQLEAIYNDAIANIPRNSTPETIELLDLVGQELEFINEIYSRETTNHARGSALGAQSKMNLATKCPTCGREMSANEYMDADRCASCGKSFSSYRYTVVFLFCIALTGIAWLIHWIESTKVTLIGAVATTCFGLGYAALTVTVDQILLRTTDLGKRKRSSLTGWVTLGILLLVAFFLRDYVATLANE